MTENTTPMTEAVQETLETVTDATNTKVEETAAAEDHDRQEDGRDQDHGCPQGCC
jgi:hypothetical protein